MKRNKKNNLYRRAINRCWYVLDCEEDVMIMNYMINLLKYYNIDYVIEPCKSDENLVNIIPDCDDDMIDFLSSIEINL